MISKPLPDALYPFMICLKPEKRYPFRAEPPHIGHYGEYNPPPPPSGPPEGIRWSDYAPKRR